jgi:hypothetical protein
MKGDQKSGLGGKRSDAALQRNRTNRSFAGPGLRIDQRCLARPMHPLHRLVKETPHKNQCRQT